MRRNCRAIRSGLTQVKVGIVGDNLLNEDVRFAQSFKKDEVLQPGRTVKVFATVKFYASPESDGAPAVARPKARPALANQVNRDAILLGQALA